MSRLFCTYRRVLGGDKPYTRMRGVGWVGRNHEGCCTAYLMRNYVYSYKPVYESQANYPTLNAWPYQYSVA